MEHYKVEVLRSRLFNRWLMRLKDSKARALILKRILRFQTGRRGDVSSVGEGVFEIRIDYGPGYRLYGVDISENCLFALWRQQGFSTT